MNIGKAIREIREGLNITQIELSKKAGVSQTSISQIEAGVKNPRKLTIKRICKALSVKEDSLYTKALDNDAPTNDALLDLIDKARVYNDGWVFTYEELLAEYKQAISSIVA